MSVMGYSRGPSPGATVGVVGLLKKPHRCLHTSLPAGRVLPPVHKILLPLLQLSDMGHNTGVSTG